MISIALCTYNGGKYIREQLQSLIQQTLQPDEIVICDDCSGDDTIDVVEETMKGWDGTWHLVRNRKNLGYRKNFQQAIRLCHGDIIFLSDQDDVWDLKKLEIIMPYFEDPTATLVFHDAKVVDENLQLLRPSFWNDLEFYPKQFEREDYSRLLYGSFIQGAASAFRRQLFEEACPFPEEAIHDEWLGMNAAFLGKIVPVPLKLINYRQTGHNQIGGVLPTTWDKVRNWMKGFQGKLQEYTKYLHHQEAVWKALSERYPGKKLGPVESVHLYQFYQSRIHAIKHRQWLRLPPLHVYKEMYNNPAQGKKQYIKDRLMIFK